MKALDPIADAELYSAAQEARAINQKYFCWVWETFELTVGGLIYQVEVDANVVRTGDHGDMEICSDDFCIKKIHVGLPQFGNPILLEEDHLRSDHLIIWTELEKAIDFAILKHASKSTDWEIQDV